MPQLLNQNLRLLVQYLIDSYPIGISTGELSRILGVSDQTIRNYIIQLEDMGIPVEPEKSPYCIDPEKYRSPLEFSLEEAWFLYLPIRRAVRAQQTQNTTGYQVTKKLGASIHRLLGETLESSERPQNTQSDEVFKTLVKSWYERKAVRIRYEPLEKTASHMTIAPFWFEPAVWTDSTYCIAGIGHKFEKRITLKLERIQSTLLLDETFFRPSIRELLENLQGSWGIWTSENAAKVQLRFSNRVLPRVRETCWHPSEELLMDSQGRLLWTAIIDEPQEMMPWIRSWGLDVEILEPGYLREQIVAEINRMAELYNHSPKPKRFF